MKAIIRTPEAIAIEISEMKETIKSAAIIMTSE